MVIHVHFVVPVLILICAIFDMGTPLPPQFQFLLSVVASDLLDGAVPALHIG